MAMSPLGVLHRGGPDGEMCIYVHSLARESQTWMAMARMHRLGGQARPHLHPVAAPHGYATKLPPPLAVHGTLW